MPEIASSPRWLRRYTKCVAASTLFLIFAGAMVTSTGSGLAVPDWPLSYGMLFPPMVGGIFYEHGHRLIAATVGLLTVIQAFLLYRFEPKRFVTRIGWWAVVAVIAQGLLGGLTVKLLLPPAVSIAHAALAEIFFCLNLSIAWFTSSAYPRLAGARSGVGLGLAGLALPGAVFVQILLGALMRHLGAGLAIPDFPLAFGRLVPDLSSVPIAAAFSHRLGALLVIGVTVAFGPRLVRSGVPALQMLFGVFVFGLTLQILLGAFTIWSAKQPVVTSLHVVTGAGLFAVSILIGLVSRTATGIAVPQGGAGAMVREATA